MARITDVDVIEFDSATFEVELNVRIASRYGIGEAAEELKHDAQMREKGSIRTGFLNRNIEVEIGDATQADGFDFDGEGAEFQAEVFVDQAKVPYARRVEYGFRGPDILGRRFNQKAQPYLEPPAR